MQCLASRRQLAQIKQKRQISNKRFAKTQEEHKRRAATASDKLRRLLHGNKMLPIYVDVVKTQYDSIPANYVLLKHAEVLKFSRSQELLETYIEIFELHSSELIEAMERAQMNLLIGLKMQEGKIDSLDCKLFEIVTENLATFHHKRGKDFQGSFSNLTTFAERRSSATM
eukprot:CAMPEP_0194251792 /NCGR_PEP_ID=MMETSP0158-20130606/26200_1 /TAXON_ID=33649 /ORGANISM="Thalassionema nitzschioides, Strain L26-B" /LENGTH=169 /DNA_ID=CAMNT_0038989027 /DNA_START=252 /DNA_END=761 /DNA_ORIENTATION=+